MSDIPNLSKDPAKSKPAPAAQDAKPADAKPADAKSADGEAAKPATLRPPRTINLAIAAIVADVVFSLIRSISMFGYTQQLSDLLVKSNRDAKKPKVPYTPTDVAHDLHTVRVNGLWQGLIIGIALLLLAYSLRRTSTANITRWALLIIMIMTGGPFTVIPARGLPVVPQVALVLSGLASIVAIVLLFLPESRTYFRAVAAARAGVAPGDAMPARPGLGTLFRPRPVPPPTGAQAQPQRSSVPREGGRGTKAKARADADAVARGAELARTRAKASKSRRTEG